MTTQQQTDADLIRYLREHASEQFHEAAARLAELTQPAPQPDPVVWECKAGGLKPLTQRLYEAQPDNIKRHYTRIEQPAPLALSPEDAAAWQDWIDSCRQMPTITRAGRASFAVDALLRKRVQRLTDEQIGEVWSAVAGQEEFSASHAIIKFARAVEAAHGIGEGAK